MQYLMSQESTSYDMKSNITNTCNIIPATCIRVTEHDTYTASYESESSVSVPERFSPFPKMDLHGCVNDCNRK